MILLLFLVYIALLALCIREQIRAPFGYEDKQGFHYGHPKTDDDGEHPAPPMRATTRTRSTQKITLP